MGSTGEEVRRPGAVTIELLDGLSSSQEAVWAAEQLVSVLRERGASGSIGKDGSAGSGTRISVKVGLANGSAGKELNGRGAGLPGKAQSFGLSVGRDGTVLVAGGDSVGAMYGLLELADRARYAADALDPLSAESTELHSPAVPIRGVLRTFACEVRDKPWFYSKEFWTEYLGELSAQRLNRFQLAFGMQYNYSHDPNAHDNYLCFPYPFLVRPDGWDVSADGLSDDERKRNLDALKFASDEAARRGIHFQLGLWNHAQDPGFGAEPSYRITGLPPERHAEYCADALAELLRRCPSIAGVTFRVHYEGGVPEIGQEEFWQTVFSGVGSVGRPIEIDMHSKGVSEEMIRTGAATGSSLLLSPKYWAEHEGLPYHQTRIRDLERPREPANAGLDAKTAYARRFTRYGYGDFLREDRSYGVVFRVWPGTQRVLLWGDPVLAAGYGRLSTFAGALGVEFCEPLTFSGRKDSGGVGGRDPHAGSDLALGIHEWKKYRYTYRVRGRLLYEPDADPSGWRRFLDHELGPASPHIERALAAASRVLPLVTVAHGAGASNNGYWPEMYVNMPIAEELPIGHYESDTAEPKTFSSVSPFDPEIFMSIDEHVGELLGDEHSGRYSPEEVGQWLVRLAERAEEELSAAKAAGGSVDAPSFRRVEVDIAAQAGIARFFAGKFRAGIAYSLFKRTGEPGYLAGAIESYETARNAFASVAAAATGVYQPDLTFGNRPSEHGHWADRLPAIDADLDALRREQKAFRGSGGRPPVQRREPQGGPRPSFDHVPPASFKRGDSVRITGSVGTGFTGRVVLHYRHVNQGEPYRSAEMSADGGKLAATIEGKYTDSPYALVYYFSLHAGNGNAWLSPGMDVDEEVRLATQPYHLVRQAQSVSK